MMWRLNTGHCYIIAKRGGCLPPSTLRVFDLKEETVIFLSDYDMMQINFTLVLSYFVCIFEKLNN
jgi:hypothetical protein